MKIAGLDISLNSTGAASIDTASGRVIVTKFKHKNLSGHERLQWNAKQLGEFVADHDLAVIETPAYAAKSSVRDLIDGNHWLMRHEVWKRRVPYAMVATTQLKVYATMNGAAKKPDVVAAMREAFPGIQIGGDDEADAFVLATMGCAYRGQPVDLHVARGRSTLAEVKWPDQRGEPTRGITRKPHPTREAFSPARGVPRQKSV
jgi:Holliday junction resolvasome RuvABC endonuclease subunit